MRAISLSARRRRRISVLGFLALVAIALIATFPAPAQQPDFSAVAAQAARAVEKFKSDSVVVLDFVGPDTFVSELGRNMADQFSASLANVGGKFAVIDRAKIRQAIESNRFAPEIITDPEMAMWVAKGVGAESGISGRLSLEGRSLKLTIYCFQVKDGNISGSFRATYPLTDEWNALLAKNIDPDSAMPWPDWIKLPSSKFLPSCRMCPAPPFTQAALEAKYNGAVVLLVVIGKDGRVRDFRVTKGLPYGLTVIAVQTVQKWTFNPAKGPDGKPIDLSMPIEVVFSIH